MSVVRRHERHAGAHMRACFIACQRERVDQWRISFLPSGYGSITRCQAIGRGTPCARTIHQLPGTPRHNHSSDSDLRYIKYIRALRPRAVSSTLGGLEDLAGEHVVRWWWCMTWGSIRYIATQWRRFAVSPLVSRRYKARCDKLSWWCDPLLTSRFFLRRFIDFLATYSSHSAVGGVRQAVRSASVAVHSCRVAANARPLDADLGLPRGKCRFNFFHHGTNHAPHWRWLALQ